MAKKVTVKREPGTERPGKGSGKKKSVAGSAAVRSAIARPTQKARATVKKEGKSGGGGKRTETSSSEYRPPRKPHRFRPGTRSLMEIRRLQKTNDSCFRKTAFKRLIGECMEEVATQYGREKKLLLSEDANAAILAATEEFLVKQCRAAYRVCLSGGHVMLKSEHLQLARMLLMSGNAGF